MARLPPRAAVSIAPGIVGCAVCAAGLVAVVPADLHSTGWSMDSPEAGSRTSAPQLDARHQLAHRSDCLRDHAGPVAPGCNYDFGYRPTAGTNATIASCAETSQLLGLALRPDCPWRLPSLSAGVVGSRA